MIFVIFAILCSASLNILFKYSEKQQSNRLAVSFFSFLGSTTFSLVLLKSETFAMFRDEMSSSISGQITFLTPSFYALLLGLINGFLYFGAFYVLQLSTSKNGSAMTATFNKLGVMVPAVLSVLVFHEVPKLIQIAGVIIASIAILMVYLKKEENSIITLRIALIGTFLLGGLADFTSKIFQVHGSSQFENLYLFFTFFFSLIITGLFMLIKDRRIKRLDVIVGLVSGIPSQLISLFLLRSLSSLPGFVVFPLYSVGVILVVNLVNLLFFKERLTRRQSLAIGAIVVAVVLLNV